MRGYRSALFVSSDAGQGDSFARVAYRCGLHLVFSACLEDARAPLARKRFALIFCSDRLSDGDLTASLHSLQSSAAGTPVIVVSRLAEWSACVDAMCAGAFDYIAWPPDPAETERVVRLALGEHRAMRLHSAA